jgi:hypothetical protein
MLPLLGTGFHYFLNKLIPRNTPEGALHYIHPSQGMQGHIFYIIKLYYIHCVLSTGNKYISNKFIEKKGNVYF